MFTVAVDSAVFSVMSIPVGSVFVKSISVCCWVTLWRDVSLSRDPESSCVS